MNKLKELTGADLKKYVNLIPDDTAIYVGIGEFQSPLVDILIDRKNDRVIFVNHTYLEDCIEKEAKYGD